MPIPNDQLETWSHQGAVDSAISSHKSVRAALEQYEGWKAEIDFDVYLQGSYRNSTNIRGDSDVDVVAQLHKPWHADTSGLSVHDLTTYRSNTVSASYGQPEFREQVLDALRTYYGSAHVVEGRKCIKVQTSYLPVDVLPCIDVRYYHSFTSHESCRYVEGLRFLVQGQWIENFPKLHYQNGAAKNSSTNEIYKPTVRMFKNARNHLSGQELAPSYFLECLLYNAPDDCFGSDWQSTYLNVVHWLATAHYSEFVMQNERRALFGDGIDQWRISSAVGLIAAFIELWDTWR